MTLYLRILLPTALLLLASDAYAECNDGTSRGCDMGDCPGITWCINGQYGECIIDTSLQSCSAQCGAGATFRCDSEGVASTCQPPTAGQEMCGNGCDENRNGIADEGCAGSQTFDYCEYREGVYTRWTCGCAPGTKVGYCLGVGDSLSSCSSGTCLQAPAFASGSASQLGGDFQCCVSNQPCSSQGYITEAFHCTQPWDTNFECAPNQSCADSNQCESTCQGVAPTISRTTGDRSGEGAYCRPDPESSCGLAQGGMAGASLGGVRAFAECEDFAGSDYCEPVEVVGPSTPWHMLPRGLPIDTPPPSKGEGSGRGGGGAGGGGGSGGATAAPAPTTCNDVASSSSASAMSSSTDVSLTDLATRYSVVDMGIQGTLGGFNLLRKYVSSDKTWAYQSLLGNTAAAYLPKPFGGSPTNGHSLRWWHSLYSFVYPKGWKPGISTWAVRDTDGAVLEYEACSNGSTACFAKPRKTTLWSHDQLYWSGSQFILFKQGTGRYVYGDVWLPPPGYGDTGKRYFLTRIEDEVVAPDGSARTRLQLTYASPESTPGQLVTGCPGISRLGNGVPFIARVTTEDGARLHFHYTLMGTFHHVVPSECVLQDIALADNPTSPGNTSQQIVAQYFYPNSATPQSGLLEAVSYPQTGDMVSYSGGTTTWSVFVNNVTATTHNYDTSGQVTTAANVSSSSTSTSFSGSGGCGPSQSSGPAPCSPSTATRWGGAGDSMESSIQFYRRFFQDLTDYAPHPLVTGYEESCASGNCTSFRYALTSHEEASLNSSPLRTVFSSDKKSRWSSFDYVFAADASLSPFVPQPLSKETRKQFAGASTSQFVRMDERTYMYGAPVSSAIPRSTKPILKVVDTRPSVIQQGAQTETTRIYDEQTNQLKAVIQSGWTKTFDGTSWSSPVQRFIGTFHFTYHKCKGDSPGGRGDIKEVHGPCFVSGLNATDCDVDTSFPATQYHYYPSTEPSNRANRLWKVSRFPRLTSPNSCVGAPAVDVVFNDYDARGNILSVTDPNNVTTTIERQGGRVTSTTTAGAVTRFFYGSGNLVALQHPEGNFDVFCYRAGTVPGDQGCTGGSLKDQLQWTAKAADAAGIDWSESIALDYWPDGTLQSVRYDSPLIMTRTRWRERFVHDGHGRLTRHYPGPSTTSYAAVYSYDKTNRLTGIGFPANQAPDFCAPDATGRPTSELCALLTYDSLDRLTQFDEFPSAGTQQQTLLSYDPHDNVTAIQTGCDGQASCTEMAASYVYDDFGNMLEVKVPQATSPARYAYDALGNVIIKQTSTMVRRNQHEHQAYAYDGLGRILDAKAIDTSGSATLLYAFGYDLDGMPPVDCEQNLRSVGRLRFREDSFGRTWYQYDASGHILREMRLRHPLATAHCGQGGDSNPDTRYSYTLNGNLQSIIYPHGRQVDYAYGTGGSKDRVSAVYVTLFEDGVWTSRLLVSNVRWEPYGGLWSYQLHHHSLGDVSTVEYSLGGHSSEPPKQGEVSLFRRWQVG